MELIGDLAITEFADDIRKKVFAEGLSHYKVEIKRVSDPIFFIRKGFLPFFEEEKLHMKFGQLITDSSNLYSLFLEAYILDRYTEEEINFWFYPRSLRNEFDLREHKHWIYGTIEYYKNKANRDADSLPLLLYAPEYVYKSKRPVTDMLLFRNPDLTIPHIPKDNYIPVTRYAEGMSRGLYYEEGEDEKGNSFCGTFYYLERESRTFLGYDNGRSLSFVNKYQAAKYLLGKTRKGKYGYKKTLLEEVKQYEIYPFLEGESDLPRDLMMTPLEIFEHFPGFFKRWNLDDVKKLPQVKRYVGMFIGFYAQEDMWDQRICKLGREMGIDVIVLERMIGSHQIVTEVLDTRSRSESFNTLIFR